MVIRFGENPMAIAVMTCPSSMIESTGGSLFLASVNYSSNNIRILRLDKNGNKVWEKSYTGGRAYSITESTDGNLFVAGTAMGGTRDVRVLKLDKNGNGIWDRSYGKST